MTASDISKKSGVPYSKIYEVLNGLEEKGWLESDSSRPQKFFPKSPSSALEAMRMRQETNFRESQSIVVNELMPMYTKSGIKERPEIWVARGVFNIVAKVNEIVQNARQELLVALPFVAAEVAKPLQPVLRTLHDKGVKINILASAKIAPEMIKALSRVAEVRLTRLPVLRFLNGIAAGAHDDEAWQVLVFAAQAIGHPRSHGGADHAGLAGFAKGYFQYLWEDSTQRKKK